MKGLIIILFLLSVFLFFYALFTMLLLKRTSSIDRRVDRYLKDVDDVLHVGKQKKKSKLQFSLAKKQIRQKILTKDKNTKLELMLSRAGLPLKPEEYVMFQWITTLLFAGVIFLVTDNLLMALIGSLIGFYLPKLFLVKKQKDQLNAFNDALPEMISALIGGLRAGFSFQQGLKSVAEEAASPMKEEIENVLREMQYGASVEDALNRWKERMPSDDLDLMIQAIIIQRQLGGNLATILDKIVETIRDRIKIQGQISTLTAQGRLSGAVVGLLPVVLGLLLFVIEPEYIGGLFKNPVGIVMVVVASISSGLGFLFIHKITKIEV
ncbi:type II secretion system F family protein [Aquibacillus salsiterrae]|uniref:Type II secretion system F family protein n=1 Tax=Aquibacillus salsiterrae TaxID=2950439 RepID=A0A9X3WGC4_9BACI|nr:type II secretion system F family protein [Aquibacillus salsiterrae]MDC3416939.1 type II secretion system F family protein [Aquibacillus salsiterrae]